MRGDILRKLFRGTSNLCSFISDNTGISLENSFFKREAEESLAERKAEKDTKLDLSF